MLSRLLYIMVIFGFILGSGGCIQETSDRQEETVNSENRADTPASIEFERVYYDFGNIQQGEKVSYTFQFENTGGSPLIIEDAIASCGCTVPEYDKDPISPGKQGSVEVIFDSSGRRGNQYKSVIIKTNTPNKEKRLTIKANVLMN